MTRLDPGEITLTSLAKTFEYEKIARELDSCDDVEELRNAAKCFLKLCMKTQETVKTFPNMN
mgnify:CR=1 FL=1